MTRSAMRMLGVLLLTGSACAQAGEQAAPKEIAVAVPKEVLQAPRHIMPLDSALAISTGKKVLLFGVDGKEPQELPGADAWMYPLRDAFTVVSGTTVTVYGSDGKLLEAFRDATPIFAHGNRLGAVAELQDGKTRVKFLNKDFKVEGETVLDGPAQPRIVDGPARVMAFVGQAHVPFSPVSISLWKGNEPILDVSGKYGKTQFLGISGSGRVYILAPDGNKRNLVCLDSAGKELWKHGYVRDPGGLDGHVFESATRGAGDMVFLAHEAAEFADQPGRLRLVLIDASGKVLKDLSDWSYNRPLVAPDSSCALLTGQGEVCCISLESGEIAWRKKTGEVLAGEDIKNYRGAKASMVGKTPVHAKLFAPKAPTEDGIVKSRILVSSFKTGKLLYDLAVSGKGYYELHVSEGGTIWLVSKDEVKCFVLGSLPLNE